MNASRLALLLLALLVPFAGAQKKEEGFRPLFDGKTLDGWVHVNAAPGTFFVKDDMLVTTGVPTGLLRTARQYENFVLELEWMHVVPKGNSGLFVWSDPLPAVGVPFSRAIEVQVLDGVETKNYTSDGDIFSIWGARMKPDRPHPSGWERCLPSEKRARPAGQWNHYRVECNDGVIKLAVNGKVVSGGSACTPRKGYICLEAEGSECRFRKLKIKELPSTKPKAEETCPEAQGHVTLFTGIDLKGWRQDKEEKKAWQVLPGPNVLRGREGGWLWTEKGYESFELMLDCRVPKGGGGPLVHLGPPKKGAVYDLSDKAVEGRWTRWTFRIEKGNFSLHRDGVRHLVALWDAPGKHPIGLAVEKGGADFTNLFLRELK